MLIIASPAAFVFMTQMIRKRKENNRKDKKVQCAKY